MTEAPVIQKLIEKKVQKALSKNNGATLTFESIADIITNVIEDYSVFINYSLDFDLVLKDSNVVIKPNNFKSALILAGLDYHKVLSIGDNITQVTTDAGEYNWENSKMSYVAYEKETEKEVAEEIAHEEAKENYQI